MMPTHRRIRRFNTRDTYPDQKLDNDLCQAVVAGDTVYLRGQVGQDLETAKSVGIGDPAAQAEQAMQNVAQLLGEAGSRLEEIVKIVIYLTDPRYREPVYRVVGRWLKGVYPVSTGLIVKGLAKPEYLMEIDIDAVIQEKPAQRTARTSKQKATTGKRTSLRTGSRITPAKSSKMIPKKKPAKR